MNDSRTTDTQTLPKLGFLGLGQMGGAMTRTLLEAGYPVIAYDPAAEALSRCADAGAEAAQTDHDVAGGATIVLTSLRSSAMFVQVAEQVLLPNAQAGQIFMDMGTTNPGETRRIARAMAEKGASLIDAPVSGGPVGCENGTLHIFAGGDRSAVDRAWPILEVLGHPDHTVYCGPAGTGQAVKGVNQLAMGLVDAAYVEAVAYGVLAGADPTAIAKGVGGDDGFRKRVAQVAQLAADGKADDVLVKFPELPYFLAEAREKGFDMPMTQALLAYLDPAPRDWVDNMNRPRVAFWHQLTTRPSRTS